MSDLFEKSGVEPRVVDAPVTFHSFYKYSSGPIEVHVGRADLKPEVVVSVTDPDRGSTQVHISAQELAQMALRIHRERFREDGGPAAGSATKRRGHAG